MVVTWGIGGMGTNTLILLTKQEGKTEKSPLIVKEFLGVSWRVPRSSTLFWGHGGVWLKTMNDELTSSTKSKNTTLYGFLDKYARSSLFKS